MKMNEWCTGCKEYDAEKHCCPRFNQVIRNTMNERINDVLDKISAEIEEIETYDGLYIDRFYVLQIIDKYRKEQTDADSN